MLKRIIFFTALLFLAAIPALANRVLMTYCEIAPDDEYFEEGLVFVMTKDLSTQEIILWYAEKDMVNWYAINREEGGFETDGGIWSLTLAGDVYVSLEKGNFAEYEMSDSPTVDAIENPPKCTIDYSGIQGYESGAWRKDASP